MQLYPRVLFFINGPTPTPEQMDAAKEFGPGVAFRNATLLREGEPIEDADGVAGEVPERYKALPSMDDREAVEKRMKARFDPAAAEAEMTDEQKEARAKNDALRGSRPATVNERVSDSSVPMSERLSQSGAPRVSGADPNAWSGATGEGKDTGADPTGTKPAPAGGSAPAATPSPATPTPTPGVPPAPAPKPAAPKPTR